MITIIFGIIFILTMVGAGLFYFLVVKKSKNPSTAKNNPSENTEPGSSQSFLPFEGIVGDMIDMGGHKYRAVIEVSSVNYHLKTDGEKETIEIAFNRFVNSLNHPIAVYIQTRVLDYSKMIETLREELQRTVKKYPRLEQYATMYFNNMVNINDITGSSKQKKKYIIIPFEEAIFLEKLNDEEKLDYSFKNMRSRVSIVMSNLHTAGFSSRMLNNKELVELIYSTFNKDSISEAEDIAKGEYFIPVVSAEDDKHLGMTEDERVDFILYEAQEKIKKEVLVKDIPEFMRSDFMAVLKSLDSLRSKVEGE